jgi:hypothetical protein
MQTTPSQRTQNLTTKTFEAPTTLHGPRHETARPRMKGGPFLRFVGLLSGGFEMR